MMITMSEEEKKALPKEVMDEIKNKAGEAHDVSEIASKLEGKIPTEKKDES